MEKITREQVEAIVSDVQRQYVQTIDTQAATEPKLMPKRKAADLKAGYEDGLSSVWLVLRKLGVLS